MKPSKILVLLALILLVGVCGLAQMATSRLEGSVQDESGAVIPGAKVAVVNAKTQVRSETSADAAGRFIFPSLPPSTYNLIVEAAGFRQSVKSDLMLLVGTTTNEIVKLEIGAVTESVSVQANEIRVQTTDAQIGNSVTVRDIDILPQLGRNPMVLSVFTTGTQIDPTGYDYSRVNGTRGGSSNATLDGIEVNDPVVPRLGLAMTPTSTDTVAEFRIVTSGGKAEYGRNAGAQIEMITNSGTNQFHGTAFDYLRNTKLNANNFFNNKSGVEKPKYIRNMFGGTFGGRIIKDRTFFFGDYEGTRIRQEKSVNRDVITASARSGVFQWKDTATGQIQSFNLYGADPRRIGMDPWAKKHYWDLMPDANNTELGDGLNTGGFRFNPNNNSYNDQYTIKVDHQLTSNHRLFFRWSWMRSSAVDGLNSAEASFPGLAPGTQGGNRWGWSAGSSWNVTPTTINELRVGVQKSNSDFLRPRLHEAMMASQLFTDPLGSQDFGQGRTVPMTIITDNLTRVHGSHTIKAGAQFRRVTQDTWNDSGAWPLVATWPGYGNAVDASIGPKGNINSTDRTTFENLYNDLLGRIGLVRQNYYSDLTTFQAAGTSRVRKFRNHDLAIFLQDDWKITRRLTLNYGLRWEYYGVPYEANLYQGNLTPLEATVVGGSATNLTVKKGGNWYNNDWNNFAPRLGFAFDPKGDGKWAIRGSAGLFYDHTMNSVLTAIDANTNGFAQTVTAYPNQNGTDLRPNDGIPATEMPAAPVLTLPATRTQNATVNLPGLRTGYVGHFSLSVQREIMRNTTVEAAYVGTHGLKLFYRDNLNQFKIYESGFLDAFKELQANRTTPTAVSANNPLVRIFGSAATAISRIGSNNIANGVVGTAANTVDTNYYPYYSRAGLPDTWLRNFPQYQALYLGTNDGRSYYNSFQFRVSRRQGSLALNANYTWSKSMDNTAQEGNGTNLGSVIDYRNAALNRGLSDFDHKHSFNGSVLYTLPVGRNKRFLGSAPGWVDSLLGGWDVGVLNTWQSGSPFTVTTGRATGPNSGAASWAVYSGSRDIAKLNVTGDSVYMFSEAQRAMFGFPGAAEYGNTGRNTFRGPRFFNVDLSLSKKFKITEGQSVQFRAESYNAFNNVNFGNPAASILTPATFGKISSTIGPNGNSGARIFQMALRYSF